MMYMNIVKFVIIIFIFFGFYFYVDFGYDYENDEYYEYNNYFSLSLFVIFLIVIIISMSLNIKLFVILTFAVYFFIALVMHKFYGIDFNSDYSSALLRIKSFIILEVIFLVWLPLYFAFYK